MQDFRAAAVAEELELPRVLLSVLAPCQTSKWCGQGLPRRDSLPSSFGWGPQSQ